jgi:3-methyladenine DNA glycosylase AlkD
MISKIKKELRKYASVERKKTNEWFFKTGKGEYGEGDVFLGVRVPNIRKVAKKFSEVDFKTLEKLLHSKIHEERSCALYILVAKNQKAIKNENKARQKDILKFYLKHRRQVNNWDLVDSSAHHILGRAILNDLETEKLLDKFIQSENLWERRIGIISTWVFIRMGKIETTLRLSKKLLADKEDLMHKAVGWMLREAWKLGEEQKSKSAMKEKKQDKIKNKNGKIAQKKVEKFLIKNYNKLPRTTLRYAIERMPEKKRKKFLRGEF